MGLQIQHSDSKQKQQCFSPVVNGTCQPWMQSDSWGPAPSGSAGLCLLCRSLCKGQRTATPTAAKMQRWNDHVVAAMPMGNVPRTPELSIIDHWDELEPETLLCTQHRAIPHRVGLHKQGLDCKLFLHCMKRRMGTEISWMLNSLSSSSGTCNGL